MTQSKNLDPVSKNKDPVCERIFFSFFMEPALTDVHARTAATSWRFEVGNG